MVFLGNRSNSMRFSSVLIATLFPLELIKELSFPVRLCSCVTLEAAAKS